MTKVLIVCANFYPEITDELVSGARATLTLAKVAHDELIVPGAFEIPAAIRFAIDSMQYDGYIALGCVIRGETSHYDYVCGESARALMDLALAYNAAIGYGILTCETMEQAKVRAEINQGNKGRDAAEACLTMIGIKHRFQTKP